MRVLSNWELYQTCNILQDNKQVNGIATYIIVESIAYFQSCHRNRNTCIWRSEVKEYVESWNQARQLLTTDPNTNLKVAEQQINKSL